MSTATTTGFDDLVTGAEIGRRLGISRQRVAKIAVRAGFPEPLGRLGQAKVWRWADVRAWAEERQESSPAKTPVEV